MRWWDWYGDGSLVVLDIALACCALEFDAAASGAALGTDFSAASGAASGAVAVDGPPDGAQVVVVVSGTVTDRLAPAVAALVDRAATESGHRPTVVSFGACAASGGPYWDSYAVTKGVDQLVEVDVYIPGCPPPPEALGAVLDDLSGRVRR